MKRSSIAAAATLALAIFFAFISTASAASKSGPKASREAVVAQVGDVPITLKAFYAFISQLPDNVQAQALSNKAAFLEALIQRMLMLRHAKESDYLATEHVKMQIERARREILIGEALRRIEEGARPKAAEILAEYEQNKAKYTEGGKVTAAHIMVASEKEANDLLAKVVKGEDFAELAKKYSLAPERALGGSLGEMERGYSKRTGLPRRSSSRRRSRSRRARTAASCAAFTAGTSSKPPKRRGPSSSASWMCRRKSSRKWASATGRKRCEKHLSNSPNATR